MLAEHCRVFRRRAHHHVDVRAQRDIQKRLGLCDEGLDADPSAPGIRTASEGQDLVNQIAGTFAGASDLDEALDRAATGANVGLRSLCVAEYRANDVVEIVCDAAREGGGCLGTRRAGLARLVREIRPAPQRLLPATPGLTPSFRFKYQVVGMAS